MEECQNEDWILTPLLNREECRKNHSILSFRTPNMLKIPNKYSLKFNALFQQFMHQKIPAPATFYFTKKAVISSYELEMPRFFFLHVLNNDTDLLV